MKRSIYLLPIQWRLYTLEHTRNCWIKLENVCESFSFRFFSFFIETLIMTLRRDAVYRLLYVASFHSQKASGTADSQGQVEEKNNYSNYLWPQSELMFLRAMAVSPTEDGSCRRTGLLQQLLRWRRFCAWRSTSVAFLPSSLLRFLLHGSATFF